ncbi:Alpha N-terminal protein methyltransferase 1 [Lucilia cuprina]|uniref:Alpha N-terminal protein methyltransferase 1 n=1 Tax=Lucilia cuprina TaxID=7375 RepID=A0A0L0BUB1_LUCCU|nr:alpha N-terminal protein methyltransferase 1 [Lucilia cuprina]KNC23665.1 Alpha N-terminal protein methyltransferase 1 [Lucilia cuprina]
MQEITTSEIASTQLTQQEKNGETQKPQKEFYTKAQQYWSEVPATVNGMLGGLGYINAIDVQGSNAFLRELKIKDAHKKYALDCGAGIGRVSKNLLMPMFGKVDMVEQDPTFAAKAKDYCTADSGCTLGYPNRLGEIHNMGLQQFVPPAQKYDLVWSQWVLGHLTDDDLLAFFRRIHMTLRPEGHFVLKENVTKTKEVVKDETDSSVTRPLKTYEMLLKQAGFRIVKMSQQKSFPKGLFPVYMIACRPVLVQ